MGLGSDNNNYTPEEGAGSAAENDTTGASSGTSSGTSSGKEKTTAGSDIRSMSVSGESLYAVLNLSKGASEEEIKKAYRKQALKHHPDKNRNDPSAEDKFKDINRAHKVLTDEKKKQIYDEYGSMGLYIADTVGDDFVGLYFMVNSKCFKITSIICCIATGCCCCCCCCFFCFCGCCGLCSKCRPAPVDEEDCELSDIDNGSTDGRDTETLTNQPQAMGGTKNEVFVMPEP